MRKVVVSCYRYEKVRVDLDFDLDPKADLKPHLNLTLRAQRSKLIDKDPPPHLLHLLLLLLHRRRRRY